MAGFDWYQGTVRSPVDDVLEACQNLAERIDFEHGRGMHGYATSTALRSPDGIVGHLWHGGSHPYPHVVFTGEAAQPGAELIRARFPEHSVSRLDVREDFADCGGFDRMQPVLLDAAKSHRIRVGTAGDHLLTMEGRTLYLGAPKSPCRLRMYDKAAELRAKFAADPVRLLAVPDHMTRVEAQVRPETKEARAAFASIEPLAVFGCSAWLRQVWSGLVGLDLEPVQVTKPYRQSDDERALAYLLAQYGAVLQRLEVDLGSWSAVGSQLGYLLSERQAAARKVRRS